jgi:mannose-1-phosphate guanylyltransferase
MLINAETYGRISILRASSYRLTSSDLGPLLKAREQMMNDGSAAMIVDLAKVRRVTYAGLGALVEFTAQFKLGQPLAFCNANASVHRFIRQSPAEQLLPYYKTVDEVLHTSDFRRCQLAGTKALLLCAGKGTRMAPLSDDTPKPMLELFGKPILSHLLQHLDRFGIQDVMLNPGHLGDQIVQNLPRPPSHRLQFFNEGQQTPQGWQAHAIGSASTLARLQHRHNAIDDDVFVLCGDALTDIDLADMMRQHKSSGAELTIAARQVPRAECSKYGILQVDRSGRIRAFQEKPQPQEAKSTLASAGIYIINPRALVGLGNAEGLDIATELLPAIMKRGGHLHSYVADFEWVDMGNPKDYAQAHFKALRGEVKTLSPSGEQKRPGIWIAPGARVSRRAKITPPCYIGSGATVAAGVELQGPCVIGAGSRLSGPCLISNSFVQPRTWVKPGAWVEGQITSARWSVKHKTAMGQKPRPSFACLDQISAADTPFAAPQQPSMSEVSA